MKNSIPCSHGEDTIEYARSILLSPWSPPSVEYCPALNWNAPPDPRGSPPDPPRNHAIPEFVPYSVCAMQEPYSSSSITASPVSKRIGGTNLDLSSHLASRHQCGRTTSQRGF